MNKYVLEHDFGYGTDGSGIVKNKLVLRNFNDLQCFVNNLINEEFDIMKFDIVVEKI